MKASTSDVSSPATVASMLEIISKSLNLPIDWLTLPNYQAEEAPLGSPKICPSISSAEFQEPWAVYVLREVQALVSIKSLLDLIVFNSCRGLTSAGN